MRMIHLLLELEFQADRERNISLVLPQEKRIDPSLILPQLVACQSQLNSKRQVH